VMLQIAGSHSDEVVTKNVIVFRNVIPCSVVDKY
jgi:hypothetical protein